MPNEIWENFRAMSQDVGKIIKFLADTSCMNAEERVTLAHLETLKPLLTDDPEFVQFIDEIVTPFVRNTGRAKWQRDIVTDLGLALSMRKEKEAKLDKILSFDPSKLSQEIEVTE